MAVSLPSTLALGVPEAERARWEGVIALLGHPTADRRYLIPGEVSHRDLPLPLLMQTHTSEGHQGSEVVGRIETIEYVPVSEFPHREEFPLDGVREEAIVVFASGTLDQTEAAETCRRMIANGAGASVDVPPDRVVPIDPDSLEEVDAGEIDPTELLLGDYLTGIAGKIAACTIVAIPAFEETAVALVSSAQRVRLRPSQARKHLLHPPREWFETEEFPGPTPLTVTEEGRVFGHLAIWDSCHIGIEGVCTRPPRSPSAYAWFHASGEIETAEGDRIDVGKIMVSVGHAPLGYSRQEATSHYDKTGMVGAYVRAKDGRHGIWLAGAIRHDLPDELLCELRANRPSGDWREVSGALELIAVCAVPVQGFPIPRATLSLVASGEEVTVSSLICADDSPVPRADVAEAIVAHGGESGRAKIDIPTYRRRIEEQKERRLGLAVEAPAYWEPGGTRWHVFKDYPAAERKKMAKDGRALPDGSFPIADCADAEDAIRSQGRAKPSKRARVRTHIRKRVRELGCEGDIFEPYK